MSTMLQRLPQIIQIHEEDIPFLLEKLGAPEEDVKGGRSISIAGRYRSLGIAKYVLHHNRNDFRTRLKDAANLQLNLFRRFDAGEPIDRSYVSMLAYKSLFDALAAGAFDLATDLARHMGGRPELEKQFDHSFDYVLGYTLKWFVLGDREQMNAWHAKFAAQCAKPINKHFRGYVHVFQAILAGDQAAASKGLHEIVKDHVEESKSGVFQNSVDEVLCVWGLGMANLCRHRGLRGDAIPPLIPADLLL